MARRHPRQTSIVANTKGFTLIEALVALGVLTIGILTMFTMQTGSVRGNIHASQISTAATWAMDKMEEFSALNYDDSLLADERNDGTNQDANGNGIDDDDEEGAGRDRISNFGLDQRTAATADHTLTDRTGYTMYYNIAVNQPLENIKTIRFIVVRNSDQKPLVFDYYKAASL
jgi:type II secretory pathway pseudopilin PulG